jgi:ubiquitin-activating enzyme E1
MGTLGLQANVQIVVPFLTESYYSIEDLPEPSVPLDIIINFPNRIEHTIQWADRKFREIFKEIPEQAQKYLLNSQRFIQEISKNSSQNYIDNIKQILSENHPKAFTDCIKWVIHHC